MLPLEILSGEAKEGFAQHGVAEDILDLCLCLDLMPNGDYGETWLAVSCSEQKLYKLWVPASAKVKTQAVKAEKGQPAVAPKAVYSYAESEWDTIPFAELGELSVESFFSSNRIIGERGEDTYILGYCSNAPKQKLFAFLDVLKRLAAGTEVAGDDEVFAQFNAKCPKCGTVYPDQNRKVCDKCAKRGTMFKRIMNYFMAFKWQFVFGLICMLLNSLASLVAPIFSGTLLLDHVIAPEGKYHNEYMVFVICGVVFLLNLFIVLIDVVQRRINIKISTRVGLKMKSDMFSHMQKLSLSFFNNNQTGRLITRINSDVGVVQNFFVNSVPQLLLNVANVIGLTIFLMSMNWQLTLVVFLPIPIIVYIFKVKLPKLWNFYSRNWRVNSALNATLNDSLTGIRVVKAFAKETEETNRFTDASEKSMISHRRSNLLTLTVWPVVDLLIGLSSQAIWGFGGLKVMTGTMSYGEFTTFFGYLFMLFTPILFFTNITNTLTETINSAQRMFEILDAVPDVAEPADPAPVERLSGDIVFKNVSFHYVPNRPILKNVSLHIHPGDHIGLVGHTGAGKSTIANLISRLYDVGSGAIEMDGYNVKQIRTKVMRENIAIVSQEIFIFRGTIADNIRYARPEATMEEVIAAAKVANAHDFILHLPEGYETVVGSGSGSLSGGERQRISIARAILLDPSILILDEATAAMDTETERLIQDALSRLIDGKTTITIAHRLSTLRDCNYLYAIENGEIAEEGTPEELIAKQGLYYRLWSLQNEAMKKILVGE